MIQVPFLTRRGELRRLEGEVLKSFKAFEQLIDISRLASCWIPSLSSTPLRGVTADRVIIDEVQE